MIKISVTSSQSEFVSPFFAEIKNELPCMESSLLVGILHDRRAG